MVIVRHTLKNDTKTMENPNFFLARKVRFNLKLDEIIFFHGIEKISEGLPCQKLYNFVSGKVSRVAIFAVSLYVCN